MVNRNKCHLDSVLNLSHEKNEALYTREHNEIVKQALEADAAIDKVIAARDLLGNIITKNLEIERVPYRALHEFIKLTQIMEINEIINPYYEMLVAEADKYDQTSDQYMLYAQAAGLSVQIHNGNHR